jgi:hypothetical protein
LALKPQSFPKKILKKIKILTKFIFLILPL